MSSVPVFVQTTERRREQYVVVKGSGGAGLGDKIRGLAVGILLAKATDRAVWVDWADRAYTGESTNLFPYLFRIAGLRSVESCPVVDQAVPAIWSGQLSKSQDRLRADDLHARGITWQGPAPPWDPAEAMARYSWGVDDLNTEAQAIVITTMQSAKNACRELRRRGIVPQGLSEDAILQQSLRDHLRTSPVVGKQIAAFIDSSRWRDYFTIGVHVRHTNESLAARSMPRLSDYFKAADRALKKRSNAILFLSTDNSEVVGLFEHRYGPERVMTTKKWFAAPGESLHKNPLCPDPVASAQEAIVDIGLLASCDFLIHLGNSSFSIVAASLSTAGMCDRIVLFPHAPLWRRLLRKALAVLQLSSFMDTVMGETGV